MDAKTREEIPWNLRGIAASGLDTFRDLSDEDLDDLADQIAEFYAMLDTPEGKKILESPWISASMRRVIENRRGAIREWWKELPPEEAEDLAPGLKKSRYERVTFAELGEDPAAALLKKLKRGEIVAHCVSGA